MLYYNRIDISEGVDPFKSDKSTECMICYYWLFNHAFKFQCSVSNGCHDFSVLCLNISDIAIITVNLYNISKSEAINFCG